MAPGWTSKGSERPVCLPPPLLATVEGGDWPGMQAGDFWKILPREESGCSLGLWLHSSYKTWLWPRLCLTSTPAIPALLRLFLPQGLCTGYALCQELSSPSYPHGCLHPSLHSGVCSNMTSSGRPALTTQSRGASHSPPQLPNTISLLWGVCSI